MPYRPQLYACLSAVALLGCIAFLGTPAIEAGANRPVSATNASGDAPAGGKAGTRTSARSPRVFPALDLSRPFGSRRASFSPARWAMFCAEERRRGVRMLVVQARGSRTTNPYADLMLQGARQQGMQTAAYVFLQFDDRHEPGDAQVRKALHAIGSEIRHLAFFVIDVESGAAGRMPPAERVNRIGQAVEATAQAGLRPVIYARGTGGHGGEWGDLTGSTHDFSYLPLWVPRYDGLADLSVDSTVWQPWQPFGGWQARAGKQYNDGQAWGNVHDLDADENVFDWSLAQGPTRPRPYTVTPLVRVDAGPVQRSAATDTLQQPIKVTNTSGSTIYAPVSVALKGLAPTVKLANRTGTAGDDLAGAPYVDVAHKELPPGASVNVTLRFESAAPQAIEYRPVALAGGGPR